MLNKRPQSGFALLIFVVTLMLIAGIALSGKSTEILKTVKKKKIEENRIILEQAKHALLMYAFNYPSIPPIIPRGPGRLPCPDTDNNGSPNPVFNCINGNALVGRFPWNAPGMNFYNIKDADGEDLWYAVSRGFANTGPASVNYDSVGEITIRSQSGDILYDGSTDNGVAAVIIAPGRVINRDNNNDGVFDFAQQRVTPAEQIDPTNYLDKYFGNDNSQFNNNGLDGFTLGPVFDPVQNMIVMNDQVIVITTDEIKDMAAKSVIQTYKQAINTYQQNIWLNVRANYRYPWLDDYNPAEALGRYDSLVGANFGRVPSIFANYFNPNTQPSQTFLTPLDMNVSFDIAFGARVTVNVNDPLLDVLVNSNFNMAGDFVSPSVVKVEINPKKYYWDGDLVAPDVNSPLDGVWEECTGVLANEAACNRKADGTFKTGADAAPNVSDVPLQVTKVKVKFNKNNNQIIIPFNDKLVGTRYVAPTVIDDAYIYQNFDNTSGFYEIKLEYDKVFIGNFSKDSESAANNISFELGIKYYPELPIWALSAVDDWHDTLMFAYSNEMAPGQDGVCNEGVDCLVVSDYSGNDNKLGIMIIAQQHPPAAGFAFQSLLLGLFDPENNGANNLYLSKTGNDLISIVDEQ